MAWAIGFLEGGWSVRWMSWSEFVKMGLGGDWERIFNLGPDLIVGGFSLATDYM